MSGCPEGMMPAPGGGCINAPIKNNLTMGSSYKRGGRPKPISKFEHGGPHAGANEFRNSIKIWGRHHKIPDYLMDAYADHSLKGLDASYRREDLSTELFKITENNSIPLNPILLHL